MALVSVLLLIAGLIVMASAVVTLSAAQRRAAQRAEEADARKVVLDAALRVATAEIAFPKPDGPFWYPRQPRILDIAGQRVEVVLEREAGRIDLNTAADQYLVAGLVVSGMDEASARHAAARIRDWTDADDEPRPQGAERAAYAEAGLRHEPRNGPFESLEELRQVLGLEALSDEALETFTVYSQGAAPSTADAVEPVRDALAWLDPASATAGAATTLAVPGVADALGSVSYAGAVVRLRACIADEARRRCRQVIQRFTGGSKMPALVLAWR